MVVGRQTYIDGYGVRRTIRKLLPRFEERSKAMVRVYLAGAIEETGYRTAATDKYSNLVTIVDPLVEVEAIIIQSDLADVIMKKRKLTKEEKDKIVEQDKACIDTCDILVAYVRKYSAGTMMEILHAWNCQKTIYLIDPTGNFREDVWIDSHVTRAFDSIEDCFDFIVESSEIYGP